jgi:hypothetical protein
MFTAMPIAMALSVAAAGADPGTKFNTSGSPSTDMQVGVDIAPGLWVGTSLVDYPGNCTLIRFRHFPPQYTTDGVVEMPMSDIGTPLTYRITPGGGIRLGRDCIWSLISP